MIKSPYLEELREQVRTLARAEGKAEGEASALRNGVLDLGRQRFGKPASRKHKAMLNAIEDGARLARILSQLLRATSWEELLATP